MSNRRDRLIAATAALMVVLLAVSVVFAVMSAQRNGRNALEKLQLAQLDQLARLLDSAIAPALVSPAGLTNPNDGKPWNLTPHDPADSAGLATLQSRLPSTTRTGYILVDRNGVVVNGTLLTDPTSIGKVLIRPGLGVILGGKSALLPTDTASLTTPLPTILFGRPLTAGAGGPVIGALLQESDVAPDSAFTKIMTGFRRAKTDDYSFLDSNGVVIGSTDAASVGHLADKSMRDPALGFHHHGSVVTASSDIPSAGWRAVYRQSTSEFDGHLTGPLRSALLLLIVIAILGAGLTFFSLMARLRAARREQQRLATINEAREEFISIVSHELRTPATGQLGFLQTLLDHWPTMSDTERWQATQQAYSNARRLHALTRDVLDTASIEAGELPYAFEVMDLGRAVMEAVDARASQDHEVIVTGAGLPLQVRADPERVHQVMSNLLDNAAKNSPSGSVIDVRLTRDSDRALIEVSDRGTGIAPSDAGRAFEKFTRGRHSGTKGTGLGLYICRKIVEAHGGRIAIGPREGGGATVHLALPLATSEPVSEPTMVGAL